MTRSNAREIAVHLIYAVQCCQDSAEDVLNSRLAQEYYDCLAAENEVYSEYPDAKQKSYITTVVKGVEAHREELESIISRYSIGWNLNRISSLAKAIMELAMYEARYVDDVPVNVAIHEAVLLAQKFEEPETVSFVNGVLGSFARDQVTER
ncbi:MAG: transcription antitermination factor NusB [Lachnospiraceae bacterium]|nr:transcription antitermination factor NusB [Lachnospiraceae bacterium]